MRPPGDHLPEAMHGRATVAFPDRHGRRPVEPVNAERRGVPPRSYRVTTSRLTFGVLEWGPGEGPLALCLHGYPDTAWTWRRVAPRLAASGWRVVAPFMRGYAPTDIPPDGSYHVGALAHDAVELRELVGGDEAVLIGHDWGAVAASVVGVHHPDSFKRIVTIAVPPPGAMLRSMRRRAPTEAAAIGLRQMRHSWYMLFQQLPVLSEYTLDRLIPYLWRTWAPGYDATDDLALVFAALEGSKRRAAALRYYRSFVQPWRRAPVDATCQRGLLEPPQVPVLHIHGRNDGCILADLCDRVLDVAPAGSRLEILDGVGHFVPVEAPDVAADLILDFVE